MDQDAPGSPPTVPSASGNQQCRFYVSGQCKFGNNCKFQHTGSVPSPPSTTNNNGGASHHGSSGVVPCRFFALGTCKFGKHCRFLHSPQAALRSQNRQAPPPGSLCRFWAQGRCRFGESCRFSHAVVPGMPPARGLVFRYPMPAHGYPGSMAMMDPELLAQMENMQLNELEAAEATLQANIAHMQGVYIDKQDGDAVQELETDENAKSEEDRAVQDGDHFNTHATTNSGQDGQSSQ